MKRENLRFRTYSKSKPNKLHVAQVKSKRYRTYFTVADPLAEKKAKLEKAKNISPEMLRFIRDSQLTIPPRMSSMMFSGLMPQHLNFSNMLEPLTVGSGAICVGAALAAIKFD